MEGDLLVTCILNDKADVILFGECNASDNILRISDIDRVTSIITEFTSPFNRCIGIARLILECRIYYFGGVRFAAWF